MSADNMESISIKLYLREGGVRRFAFPGNGTLQALREKIASLQPDLANNDMCWKDSDGDMILITNQDEMTEAFRHLDNGVVRLYPTLPGQLPGSVPATPRSMSNMSTEQPPQPQPQQESAPIPEQDPDVMFEPEPEEDQSDPADPTLHENVICDGCQGEVRGIRYKCASCVDYDLCEICEADNKHPQHPLIKILTPMQSRQMRKTWRQARRSMRRDYEGPFPPFHFGMHRGGHGGRGHHHGHGHHPRFGMPPPAGFGPGFMGPCGWGPHFAHPRPWGGPGFRRWERCQQGCRKGGANAGAGAGADAGQPNRESGWKAPPGCNAQEWSQWFSGISEEIRNNMPPPPSGETAYDSTAWNTWLKDLVKGFQNMGVSMQQQEGTSSGTAGEAKKSDEQKSQEAAYLYQVGDQIAWVLGQMGINVDVDVEERPAEQNANSEAPAEGAAAEAEKPAEAEKQPTAPAAPQNVETMDTTPVVDADKKSPTVRESEWTFVQEADGKEPSPEKEKLYPQAQLAAAASAPAAEASTSGAPALSPRVAASLQHMQNMGFTNEGGWLTALLMNKDGDISAVLDVLQKANQKS